MINPLIPFAFYGALWYNSKSNADRANQYRKALPVLINDWWQKWDNPNMTVYFVQLATYNITCNSHEDCGFVESREAQTMTFYLTYNGMCVTTDVVNTSDSHSSNKQDEGKRLATISIENVYHIALNQYQL